jgi:hypothetical protein
VDCNKLKGLRKKLCEGWTVSTDGEWRKLSPREHERFLASFEGRPVPPKERKKSKASTLNGEPTPQQGVGTELEKLFKTVRFGTCGSCAKLKSDMNKWGPDRCELYKDQIIERLESNAKKRPELKILFTQTGAKLFLDQAISNTRRRIAGLDVPEGVLGNLKNFVTSRFKKKSPKGVLEWAYGVTTVQERLNTLLPRTLKSLAEAGFEKPHLFVDRCVDDKPYLETGLECTFHWDNIRTYGNWMTSLWELYAINPHADRYAIFQDDLVTYRNLREYLDWSPYPGEGYLNLFTYPKNHSLIKENPNGWHRSNQLGKGAVALVFNNKSVTDLLGDGYMLRRIQGSRGHKFVDGAIVEAFRKMGQSEFVHKPTLVQHTGTVSSMGNNAHSISPSWAGEGFDARELMKGTR